MNRIFLPLYIIFFCFILFFSPINDFALGFFFQQQWEKDTAADYKGFYVILEKLFEYIPVDKWNQTVVNASKNSNIPLAVIPLDSVTLTPSQLNKLQAGQMIVGNADEDVIYKRLSNSEKVIKSGPMQTVIELELGNIITTFSTVLIFFSLILIWAINLQRKMSKLNQITHQFSQGDYSVRASEKWYQQIGALNKSFNHMANQIQKHIQGQKELTNAVAHELRTPIACLRFELTQLEDEREPEMQQKCIEDMAEDIDKMEDLVEELLIYARFDYKNLPTNLATQDINLWLKHLVEKSKFPTAKSISYLDSQSLILTFEPNYMERAITNLIANATRYAKTKVEICLLTDVSGFLEIYIDDDGPGIPLEDRNNLFSPFVRADKSRARKTGGFGLGLAIVQKIIHWHGGQVSIQDSPLGGARLSIRLPV